MTKLKKKAHIDVYVSINLESVTFPSSGGDLERAAFSVVGTHNNKGLDSRSTHSSQEGSVRLHSLVMKSTRREKPRYVGKSRRIERNKTKVDDLTEPIADTELSVVGITDSYKCSEELDINHKCTAGTEGIKELFYGVECQMQDFHTPEYIFFPRVHPSQKRKVKRSHSSAQRQKSKSSYISVNQESRELNRTKMKGDECTDNTKLVVEAGK
jgi:hypothetical protein